MKTVESPSFVQKTWFLGVIVLVLTLVGLGSCRSSGGCSEPLRFGFEDETHGWVAQTYENSQGIIAIAQSSDLSHTCGHSLKLTANLEGGHPNRQTGEAFVEIPLENLENKTITVWVYLPEGAVGDPQNPNGLQVFAKDKDWKGIYGTGWDIDPEMTNRWQQVILTLNALTPSSGYIDPGFDPTQIRAVGIKIAISDGSTATYHGPIYLDSVNWP